jgi:mRNA interferase RelE/StbE
MKYNVVIPKRVQKEINNITDKYRLKILSALVVLEKNPYLGKKLDGNYRDKWSWRVWPYRIIYCIKQKQMIILLIKVGHRQGIY